MKSSAQKILKASTQLAEVLQELPLEDQRKAIEAAQVALGIQAEKIHPVWYSYPMVVETPMPYQITYHDGTNEDPIQTVQTYIPC